MGQFVWAYGCADAIKLPAFYIAAIRLLVPIQFCMTTNSPIDTVIDL